jgi:uncharacterized protein (DUF433 family)
MSLTIENDTVLLEIVNDPVPLRIDEGGEVHVGNTRVTLDIVVDAFNEGATAEEIVSRYPVLKLADAYAVISYYLRRQEEIDAYLRQEQQIADEFRKQNPICIDFSEVRDRLLARQVEKETKEHASTTR